MTEVAGSTPGGRDPTSVPERLETIDALRGSRGQQHAILSRSHDLTMFIEPDGTIAWIGPNCTELFGIGAEDFVGQNGMQLIDERDRDRVIEEFLGMSHLGEFVRTRFRITNASGEVRWIEEIATNLVDDPDVGYVVANL